MIVNKYFYKFYYMRSNKYIFLFKQIVCLNWICTYFSYIKIKQILRWFKTKKLFVLTICDVRRGKGTNSDICYKKYVIFETKSFLSVNMNSTRNRPYTQEKIRLNKQNFCWCNHIFFCYTDNNVWLIQQNTCLIHKNYLIYLTIITGQWDLVATTKYFSLF